jgi:hypothetical protein
MDQAESTPPVPAALAFAEPAPPRTVGELLGEPLGRAAERPGEGADVEGSPIEGAPETVPDHVPGAPPPAPAPRGAPPPGAPTIDQLSVEFAAPTGYDEPSLCVGPECSPPPIHRLPIPPPAGAAESAAPRL